MPTPTRDRRQFVRPAAPVVAADEENDQPEVPASPAPQQADVEANPAKPLAPVKSGPLKPYQPPADTPAGPPTGTTGGLIPQQADDTQLPTRLSDDPAVRGQQALQVAQEQFKQKQLTDNPFLYSPAIKKVEDFVGRQGVARIQSDANQQYADQTRTDRAAAIADRRAQMEQIKAENAQRQNQFLATGQQHYTDPYGRIQPVLEQDTNRPLYHPKGWTPSTDPKTKLPALMMTDKYGQRQFKPPALTDSVDPHDENLYAKDETGQYVPYMTKQEAAQHKDLKIAKLGMAALKRKNTAGRMEGMQQAQDAASDARQQFTDARGTLDSYDTQLKDLSEKANSLDATPEQRDALTSLMQQTQTERDALAERLKPHGELTRNQWMAGAKLSLLRAQARKETALEQRQQIAARLKESGVPDDQIAQHPTYQANEQNVNEAGAEEQMHQGRIARQDILAQRQQAQPPQEGAAPAPDNADVFQQREPFMLASRGIKNVGGVSIDQMAQRYGDGRGTPDPASVIKIAQRVKDLDDMASATVDGGAPQATDKRIKSIQEERTYLDGLYKQRLARMTPDQQKQVVDATRDSTLGEKLAGAGKSLAEGAATGGGSVLKGLELAGSYVPLGGAQDVVNVASRLDYTPEQRMNEVKSGEAYKLGSFIQDAAKEVYAKTPLQQKGAVSEALNSAAGAAGGFAPLVASGPLAPATIGLQTAGEGMQQYYNDAIAKGANPQRAADVAMKRALASGAVQAAIFELLPKPLQKAADKFIVDKIAKGTLSRLLANRVAQGAEGAVLGGTSQAGENVVAGKPVGEGVASTAAGMAGLQAVLPRGAKPAEGEASAVPVKAPEPTPEAAAAEARRAARAKAPEKPSILQEPQTPAQESALAIHQGLKEQEKLRQSPEGGMALKEQLQDDSALARQKEEDAKKLPADLEERKNAIEQGLTEQDRLRQSPEGGAKLKEDLAAKAATPETEAAAAPETEKSAALKQAVANPKTEYQFTVQKGGEGYPGYVQVDTIDPTAKEGERNTASSTVKDLNAAGAKLPEVPDWVPQGRYTLPELNALIEKGEPQPEKTSNAIREQSTTAVGQQPIGTSSTRGQGSEGVEPSKQGNETPIQGEAKETVPEKGTPATGAGGESTARGDGKPVVREKGNGGGNAGRKGKQIAESKGDAAVQPASKDVKLPKDAAPISKDVAPSTPESVEGKKIDKNWTAFDKDSGTLGIPRSEMPQIKSEARGALVNFMRARGVETKAGMISPDKIKPTQAEFSPEKVEAARKHEGADRPIIISSDNHIVDGHHQWMAGLDDPNTPMPVIRLNAPIDKVLAEIKDFPSAQAAKGAEPAKESVKPVVQATKPLSQRAIDALQNAKLQKPGQTFAHTPFTLAWDGAMDMAILAIKAGRAVADVVKMASDRFKAKFPDAAPEDLKDLEDTIRQAHADKSPPPEAPKAATAADKPSATVEKSKTLLNKIGDKWAQIKSEGDLKDAIAANRDSVEGMANQYAAESKSEVTDALNRGETDKAKRATADDALRFYIESGDGDADRLSAMRDKIAKSDKADPKWKAKALAAIDYAAANGDKLKDAATRYRRIMGEQLYSEKEAGLPTLEREDYVPRHQDVEDGSWLEPKPSGPATASGNRKNRSFETTADSIAAGIDPKTLSAVSSMTARVKAGMNGVHLRAWQKSLLDMKDPTTKEPVAMKPERVERADGSFYYQPPKGYDLESLGNSPVAVKKEYAGTVSALTDPSWWGKNKATVLLQKANANAKALTLAVDTFHLGRLAFRDAMVNASHTKDFTVGPRYQKGLLLADHSADEIKRMAESGEIPKENLSKYLEQKKTLDKLVSVGYNIGQVSDAMHQEMIQQMPVLGAVNKFIFQKFQRGAMSDAAILEFGRQKADNPKMSDDQVARKVSRELMTRFGNLGRQGLFKSKGWQDTARMMFLAPQWNEGLIRSELGGVKQIGQGVANIAQGKKAAMGLLGREMLTTGVSLFAASQLINLATRGHPTWENPEEGWGSKISAWIPDKLGGSSGFFLNPMGLTAETAHLLLNSFQRSNNTFDPPIDYLRSRASAVTRPLWTFLTGKNALGQPLKPSERWEKSAEDAIPAPISGGSAVRVAKGIVSGGKTEKFPGEFQKQAMQTVGLRTDKAPSPEQRMYGLAKEFNRAHGKEDHAPGEVSDFQELTESLRRGNEKDVGSAIDTLLEKRSAEDLEKYYRQWKDRSFTGSHKNEAAFIQTLNPEQRTQYIKARQERKRIGEMALKYIRQIPAGKRAGPFAPAK